ncbi:MAG: glycosyltransferase, partial [Myxococcaceae bacterium]
MKLQTPRISVIVATYNRPRALRRLLQDLSRQRLTNFEVRVVDDGSAESVEPIAREFGVFLQRQQNQGAASARHAGAIAARGDILVFVDDDMELGPDFLAAHAAVHERQDRAVVIGRIDSASAEKLPIFERWHAEQIERLAHDFTTGARRPTGNDFYTGNASVRRADYFAVGGFDVSLGHSEDSELGLRLEKAGCELVFSNDARVVHHSEHADPERFLERAFKYGRYDTKISRKHPELAHADPWRFATTLHPALSPLLFAAIANPTNTAVISKLALRCASLLDRTPLKKLAIKGTTVAFAVQYFRGIRAEVESIGSAAYAFARYQLRRSQPVSDFVHGLEADHALMRRAEARYGHHNPSQGKLLRDAVERIGLQQLVLLRATRLFHSAGFPLAAKITARLSRHLYGSDVHWEASLAPGVMLVHGFGLAISHSAKIGPGCVLFHNVTLGMGRDATTGETGAPTLEANVSVGPGASLVGPIIVGA